MKKIVLFIVSLILFTNVYALELNSKYAVLYNLNDDKVIYEVNKDEKTSIASLTKIMTTITAIENISNLDNEVTITYDMLKGLIEQDASVVGLKVGDIVTYKDLLYCTMLPSGADCANALALSIKDTESSFIDLMNEKAKSLKLSNTHFSNVTGLDDIDNYSTVDEVAIILKEALKNDTFKNVFEASNYTLSNGLNVTSTMRLSAKNKGIDISYILGGKTGTTDDAGKCLASTSYDKDNDINYLLVTVGSDYTYGNILDASNIYNYYFENYKYYDVVGKDEYVKTIDTIYSKDVVNINIISDVKYYTNEFDSSLVKVEYDGLEEIKAFSKSGLELGKINIYYNDELLDSQMVYLDYDISFSLMEFIKSNIILIPILIGIIVVISLFICKHRRKKMNKLVFVIMDGVGINDKELGNAFKEANTPNLDKLMASNLSTTLYAHGPYVGLPNYDDMGNSEVGHNAMGCGQIYSQGAKLVNEAIASKEIFNGTTWHELVDYSKNTNMHFIGLLSDGNVHSHINHLLAMLEQAKQEGIKRVCVHVLLDGRDVDATSALKYVDILENKMKELNDDTFESLIVSGGGRMYITMDRYEADWGMVERGWHTHVLGDAPKYKSATEAILDMRNKNAGIIDQDLYNFVITDDNDEALGKIKDGDSVVFFNFRGDRAIEISMAFDGDETFNKFDRVYVPKVKYAGMLQYDADKKIPLKYLTEPPKIKYTLTEELSKYGIREYAISETQKYGHVTYFWNGNRLNKFDDKLETWELVDSDNISFDKAPKMKAAIITDKLIEAIKSNKYDFLRVNYPNGDMVGHTGVFDATKVGMETVDEMIGKLMKVVDEENAILIVTADHGNCEEMIDSKGMPKTSHTTNKVPFVIYGNTKNIKIKNGEYGLANIASTIATIFDIKPNEHWNDSIIEK